MKVQYNIQSLLTFENLGGVADGSTTSAVLLVYACDLTANGDKSMLFDEFIEHINDKPKDFYKMNKEVNKQSELHAQLIKEVENEGSKKK